MFAFVSAFTKQTLDKDLSIYGQETNKDTRKGRRGRQPAKGVI